MRYFGITGLSVGLALFVVIGLVAGTLAWEFRGSSSHPRTYTDGDWGGLGPPETLFAQAPVIVAGVREGIGNQTIGFRSPVDGEVRGYREEEVWDVRVSDVVRGDYVPGDLLQVRVATKVTLDAQDARPVEELDIDVARPVGNDTHLFFLVPIADEGGDGLGLAGPVAVARFDGDSLVFLVPEAVAQEHRAVGPSRLGWDDLDMDAVYDLERRVPLGVEDGYEDPEDVQRMVQLAESFDQILDEVSSLNSAAEVEQRAGELGVTGAEIDGHGTCLKYQGVLSQRAGYEVSLGCD